MEKKITNLTARVSQHTSVDRPSDAESSNQRAFIGAALNMSWQLAAVVIAPVYAGSRLDKHLKSMPLYTLLGFGLAVVLGSLIIWRAYVAFTKLDESSGTSKAAVKHS